MVVSVAVVASQVTTPVLMVPTILRVTAMGLWTIWTSALTKLLQVFRPSILFQYYVKRLQIHESPQTPHNTLMRLQFPSQDQEPVRVTLMGIFLLWSDTRPIMGGMFPECAQHHLQLYLWMVMIMGTATNISILCITSV